MTQPTTIIGELKTEAPSTINAPASFTDGVEFEQRPEFRDGVLVEGDSMDIDNDEKGFYIGGVSGSEAPPSSVLIGEDIRQTHGTGEGEDGEHVVIGVRAGRGVEGRRTTLIGFHAGRNAGDIAESTKIGYHSGAFADSGPGNTWIGYRTGESASAGEESTFVGQDAGRSAVGYSSSVFVGESAGDSADAGWAVLVGPSAGSGSNNAAESVFIGRRAGGSVSGDSRESVGIGPWAFNEAEGRRVISVGEDAGRYSNADGCIYLGRGAGQNNTEDNIFLVTDQDGNTRMKMDLTNGELEIEGTLTENATL